jgi:hypothetical protein
MVTATLCYRICVSAVPMSDHKGLTSTAALGRLCYPVQDNLPHHDGEFVALIPIDDERKLMCNWNDKMRVTQWSAEFSPYIRERKETYVTCVITHETYA